MQPTPPVEPTTPPTVDVPLTQPAATQPQPVEPAQVMAPRLAEEAQVRTSFTKPMVVFLSILFVVSLLLGMSVYMLKKAPNSRANYQAPMTPVAQVTQTPEQQEVNNIDVSTDTSDLQSVESDINSL
jgi:hypothetical protein